MSGIGNILSREIPYYGMMQKAQAAVPKITGYAKKTPKFLTEKIKSGAIILAKGVEQKEANKKLYAYEQTGLSPYEVCEIKERNEALERRIRRLESFED